MKKISKISLILLLVTAALAGCSSPRTLYHWGSYEDNIYAIYSEPGKTAPEQQLANLEKDIQVMQASNSAPPPGFHAHLGYLYFQIGKDERALQSFETEKKLYPESKIYMNRLIARLSR